MPSDSIFTLLFSPSLTFGPLSSIASPPVCSLSSPSHSVVPDVTHLPHLSRVYPSPLECVSYFLRRLLSLRYGRCARSPRTSGSFIVIAVRAARRMECVFSNHNDGNHCNAVSAAPSALLQHFGGTVCSPTPPPLSFSTHQTFHSSSVCMSLPPLFNTFFPFSSSSPLCSSPWVHTAFGSVL